jgi:hypothetical protein
MGSLTWRRNLFSINGLLLVVRMVPKVCCAALHTPYGGIFGESVEEWSVFSGDGSPDDAVYGKHQL